MLSKDFDAKLDARIQAARTGIKQFGAQLSGTYVGRNVVLGAAEAVGYPIAKGPGGWKIHTNDWGGVRSVVGREYGLGTYKGLISKNAEAQKAAWASVRSQGLGKGAKTLGKLGMRNIGLAYTGYMAYEGYKQEGLWGAAKGVGESIASNAMFRMLWNPYVAGAALVAAGGYGAYKLGQAAEKHVRSLKTLEMSDNYTMGVVQTAGAMTMRQRSMQALQNTHLNARMALGNEALLMRTSYRG